MTVAHFVADSWVDLHSKSCLDQDHAKQVLADAEWLFGCRKRRVAPGRRRLHHLGSEVGVEVAHRSLHEVDVCD